MTKKSILRGSTAAAVALAVGLTAAPPARAALTLTAAGIADGLVLTTFATLNPGSTSFGPFGLAVTSTGTPTVFVADVNQNKIFTFNDVDGQTPATATHTLNGSLGPVGATAVGSTFWGAAIGNSNFGGTFTTYSADLATVTPQTVNTAAGGGLHPFLGMATTPNGHVIATTDSGALIEITPGNPLARVIANPGTGADGVSVSPDGTKAIVEVSGQIKVYRISDGTVLNTYSPGNSPDGTGVISGGPLDGFIVVAGNNGTLDLIDNSGVITTIATGGNRLDYTAPDPNNGSLLIDDTDVVYRLSCINAACSIGSPPPPPPTTNAPEPATLAVLALGLAGLGAVRRRRR